MSFQLNQITPLILTYNESPNLARVLERLAWAERIVVLDSFSTDATEPTARAHSNVEFVQRKFDNHTAQWNFGLNLVRTEWVLTLDADYVLSEELVRELAGWQPVAGVNAWHARFTYCVFGRPLRASLYPPRPVLFRPRACHYAQDGHTQRLEITGPTAQFNHPILHDDRKSFSHWLWAQDRYTTLEVNKLLAAEKAALSFQDRLRRMVLPAPAAVLIYTFLVKRMIFAGWPGWYYVFQRVLAELLLSLRLIEAKIKAQPPFSR